MRELSSSQIFLHPTIEIHFKERKVDKGKMILTRHTTSQTEIAAPTYFLAVILSRQSKWPAAGQGFK